MALSLGQITAEHDVMATNLDALQVSTSWRITAPLRAIKTRLSH
jgi:hypothetical protein